MLIRGIGSVNVCSGFVTSVTKRPPGRVHPSPRAPNEEGPAEAGPSRTALNPKDQLVPGRTITWLLIEPEAGLTIWYRPWIWLFGPATVTFTVAVSVTPPELTV